MARASFVVAQAGPLVTIQDRGRPALMRFGVPASGPMDRAAYEIAQAALGGRTPGPALEVSVGGLALECVEGAVTIAVAGGGFTATLDRLAFGSWVVVTIRAGARLSIRPGPWGSWTYLAFAGRLAATEWLGAAATHLSSGLGGGRLTAGQRLEIEDAEVREARLGLIPCPVWARPRDEVKIVLGPQERFFPPPALEALVAEPFRLTDSYDRMGVRLSGPSLMPSVKLDMPSEPIARGSIQVAGDGVGTVLLSDHQTTGGYPKIATVVSDQLDSFAQLRPRQTVRFTAVTAAAATAALRTRAAIRERFLEQLRTKARG
jgi:biotin-dependent carboxylase-like uncharacterized protein